MTYCAPDDPTWVLHAESLKIDPEQGEGQAWGAKLKVAGVPVFICLGCSSLSIHAEKQGCCFPI